MVKSGIEVADVVFGIETSISKRFLDTCSGPEAFRAKCFGLFVGSWTRSSHSVSFHLEMVGELSSHWVFYGIVTHMIVVFVRERT